MLGCMFWPAYVVLVACLVVATVADITVMVVFYVRGGDDWAPAVSAVFGVTGCVVVTIYALRVAARIRKKTRTPPQPLGSPGLLQGEPARRDSTRYPRC